MQVNETNWFPNCHLHFSNNLDLSAKIVQQISYWGKNSIIKLTIDTNKKNWWHSLADVSNYLSLKPVWKKSQIRLLPAAQFPFLGATHEKRISGAWWKRFFMTTNSRFFFCFFHRKIFFVIPRLKWIFCIISYPKKLRPPTPHMTPSVSISFRYSDMICTSNGCIFEIKHF